MEYGIYVPMLDKEFSVDVSYGDTYKSGRNRSFASASPFQEGAKLVQKKFCSATGKEVSNDMITHKLVKIGKEYIPIPKERLDTIADEISSKNNGIKIKTLLKKDDFTMPMDRIDGSKYTSPAKKRVRDYVELKELLKDYVMVGEATIKENSYEVALVLQEDRILVVKFASESRMASKPDLSAIEGIEISQDIIKMEKDILAKQVKSAHDFTEFEDKRIELVDELIEKIALGEELPEM
ncbi:hypothetical protein KY326_03765, partial [Candidatus Woesearchaeota archaeon]|nr:hypothetical protein [Candidatus Woesearchaeota archaeon]